MPIRIYIPETEQPQPVILFSHGLGGSREGYAYLGNHWAQKGYVCIFMQHTGSDIEVWRNSEEADPMVALKGAANLKSFLSRTDDVSFVLDYLSVSQSDEGHPLHGLVDFNHTGLAGHSYGAVTTQAIMGQKFTRMKEPLLADERISCFIAMSPSAGRRLPDEVSFGEIHAPVFCMTGAKDANPLNDAMSPDSRLRVYAALPEADKYQINFHDGYHSAFSDSNRAGLPERDPRYHKAIMELSTRFWDAYLRNDQEAKAWLQSVEPQTILIKQDEWEWK